jgi:DNA-binding MarR family transcriptional regulator
MHRIRKITSDDYERLSDFRYALRTFLHFSESAARATGLTPQQHQALLAIKGAEQRGAMHIGALSERLLLKHHSAVELVKRLELAGLVTRQADPADGRKVVLALTDQAQEMLALLSAAHLEELGKLRPLLEPVLGPAPDRSQ